MYCYVCDADQISERHHRLGGRRSHNAAWRSPLARSQRGFTLIELLIAVAIVSILATIAYPSYMDSIRKSRRPTAKTALLDLASREERFFSTHNTYSSTPADLGYSAFPTSIPTAANYYQLSVTAASATGFTLQAIPAGGQQKETTCYTYQLDNTGKQTNLDASNNPLTASQCW